MTLKICAIAALLSAASSLGAYAEGFPSGYFKMTTQFREGMGECLEGNRLGGSINGAAFMDSCQNVSGQLWRALPLGDGYYKLTTQFREGMGECLEGNRLGGSLSGAAFMDSCQNVSGQLWRFGAP